MQQARDRLAEDTTGRGLEMQMTANDSDFMHYLLRLLLLSFSFHHIVVSLVAAGGVDVVHCISRSALRVKMNVKCSSARQLLSTSTGKVIYS